MWLRLDCHPINTHDLASSMKTIYHSQGGFVISGEKRKGAMLFSNLCSSLLFYFLFLTAISPYFTSLLVFSAHMSYSCIPIAHSFTPVRNNQHIVLVLIFG